MTVRFGIRAPAAGPGQSCRPEADPAISDLLCLLWRGRRPEPGVPRQLPRAHRTLPGVDAEDRPEDTVCPLSGLGFLSTPVKMSPVLFEGLYRAPVADHRGRMSAPSPGGRNITDPSVNRRPPTDESPTDSGSVQTRSYLPGSVPRPSGRTVPRSGCRWSRGGGGGRPGPRRKNVRVTVAAPEPSRDADTATTYLRLRRPRRVAHQTPPGSCAESGHTQPTSTLTLRTFSVHVPRVGGSLVGLVAAGLERRHGGDSSNLLAERDEL